MEFEKLKGTKDWEPQEEIQLQEIFETIKNQFNKFGFLPFDTPLIEYFNTLTYKYDEDAEIVQEIFKLKDRGNRNLGLRYDLTTPLCRYVATNPHLKKPFKRYQIGKVFRDGPLKKGRMREFYQCDGDVIGVTGVEIESELLDLFNSTYKKLGIETIIEINNNKILRGSLLQSGCEEENISSYILSIDKLKKIGVEKVLNEIKDKGLDDKKAQKAIEILKNNNLDDLEKVAKNKTLKEGINELKELEELLPNQIEYIFNFSLARGLDIYTGNIWEAYESSQLIPSSLGAGGRYDNLISEFMDSKDIVPAVGISFGISPILACLKNNKSKSSFTNLLILPLNKDITKITQQLANKYREKNYNTEISYDYNLKKAFKYCDNKNIEKLIVLGNQDIEKGVYTIKNLKTKEEITQQF